MRPPPAPSSCATPASSPSTSAARGPSPSWKRRDVRGGLWRGMGPASCAPRCPAAAEDLAEAPQLADALRAPAE
jgi:hypothetical protein